MSDKNVFDKVLIKTSAKSEMKYVINSYIDDEQVGHIAYSLGNEDEVDIETMGVDAIHQRRGIARLMLEYLIENYGEFTINSGASNDGARLLQESIGFTTTFPYYRLKREGDKKDGTRVPKDIKPEPVTYEIPKAIIKINSVTDLETMYQLSKGNLEVLKNRFERVLSHALDETNGYRKSDYSNLYNMIYEFVQEKEAENMQNPDIEDKQKEQER